MTLINFKSFLYLFYREFKVVWRHRNIFNAMATRIDREFLLQGYSRAETDAPE